MIALNKQILNQDEINEQIAKLLMTKYYKSNMSYARKAVRNYHAAEDLVGELHLRIIRANLPTTDNLENYMHTVLNNLIRNYYRDKKAQKVTSVSNIHNQTDEEEPFLEIQPSQEQSPIEQVASAEARDIVNYQLERLSPLNQYVLKRFYFDNIPHSQIGAEVGLKPQSTRSQLFRAKQALKDLNLECLAA